MYQIVCCVKQIIRKYNESHKLCSYKLTLLSLICDTHEMNIQRQTSVISNFLYIEVFTQVPWTSIYPSFTVYSKNVWVYVKPRSHFPGSGPGSSGYSVAHPWLIRCLPGSTPDVLNCLKTSGVEPGVFVSVAHP